MKKRLALTTVIAACLMLASCKESVKSMSDRVFERARIQYTAINERMAPDSLPRTWTGEKYVNAGINWWCSGFIAGTYWYIYEYTKDPAMEVLARNYTHRLDGICSKKTHHDIGFQVNCSFGNAYRITGEKEWLEVMEPAAAKLATRFSPTVKAIKSWDNKKYIYPVIIDNMMNLELLVKGAELFGADSLRSIAMTHANTTIANHFREDWSTWHLVDYNPETGEVDHKQTVQGYSDDSAWSRGQAWGLYGYTMMYSYTKEPAYLEQARHIADFIIANLPEDGIPYWDFNAPADENGVILRDASAGAIMASAFVQLSRLVPEKRLARKYHAVAEKQVRTLAGDEYLAQPGENGDFLLRHSVGSLPGNSEVDVPLTYADYYFLEALLRLGDRL